MFDVFDLFKVKENVNPNIQSWVDALKYYDEESIKSFASDVWITARTIEDYALMPAVIQNVLLSNLKFAIVKHTVQANPDIDASMLKSHLNHNIGYNCHGTTASFDIMNKSLFELEDIKRAITKLVGCTHPF